MLARVAVSTLVCGCAVAAALAPNAGARTGRSLELPLQGSSKGNYGLARADFRYGAHGHARRPTATIVPAWSQAGSYVVAVLRHPATRRATAFTFTANQNNPPTPMSSARVLFKSTVGLPRAVVGAPMALTLSFSTTEMCRGLSKRTISPSSFAVLASGGPALGTLTPADEIAQGLQIVCNKSGGDGLRAALAASAAS